MFTSEHLGYLVQDCRPAAQWERVERLLKGVGNDGHPVSLFQAILIDHCSGQRHFLTL